MRYWRKVHIFKSFTYVYKLCLYWLEREAWHKYNDTCVFVYLVELHRYHSNMNKSSTAYDVAANFSYLSFLIHLIIQKEERKNHSEFLRQIDRFCCQIDRFCCQIDWFCCKIDRYCCQIDWFCCKIDRFCCRKIIC